MIKVKSTFKTINQMVRVISRDYIEINPGEYVREIIIEKRILFWNFKKTYRKVHGNIFRYKYGRYTKISPLDWEVKSYFDLPIDPHF